MGGHSSKREPRATSDSTESRVWNPLPVKDSAGSRSNTGLSDSGKPLAIPANAHIEYPDLNWVNKLLFPDNTDLLKVTLIDIPTRIQGAGQVYMAFRKWVLSYRSYGVDETAFQMFRADWRIYRLTIQLQMRLMVEQVLYDLGYPWRSLCTGFGPVKG